MLDEHSLAAYEETNFWLNFLHDVVIETGNHKRPSSRLVDGVNYAFKNLDEAFENFREVVDNEMEILSNGIE